MNIDVWAAKYVGMQLVEEAAMRSSTTTLEREGACSGMMHIPAQAQRRDKLLEELQRLHSLALNADEFRKPHR